MINVTMTTADARVTCSTLGSPHGDWMQCLYSVVPKRAEPVADQISGIDRAEAALFAHLGIDGGSVVARRFFSSDLINHRDALLAYRNHLRHDCFFSITGQPPVQPVKLAMLGMCLNNVTARSRNDNRFCCETTSGARHIFVEQLMDPDPLADSELQTQRMFEALRQKLSDVGASIEDNLLRTWIYAPHVDADYAGIVKGRKHVFDQVNLTQDTHYIASTGIQGAAVHPDARVSMDAYAVTGLDNTKVRYIKAPDHLSPTHIYGVTFERATAMEIGKTAFLFISGTASIDRHGDIVHPGNVRKQAARTLENISALLAAAGFDRADLSSFLVYLRDATDYRFVKPVLDRFCRPLPVVWLKAPVCRPGWLIEIEATAARASSP